MFSRRGRFEMKLKLIDWPTLIFNCLSSNSFDFYHIQMWKENKIRLMHSMWFPLNWIDSYWCNRVELKSNISMCWMSIRTKRANCFYYTCWMWLECQQLFIWFSLMQMRSFYLIFGHAINYTVIIHQHLLSPSHCFDQYNRCSWNFAFDA